MLIRYSHKTRSRSAVCTYKAFRNGKTINNVNVVTKQSIDFRISLLGKWTINNSLYRCLYTTAINIHTFKLSRRFSLWIPRPVVVWSNLSADLGLKCNTLFWFLYFSVSVYFRIVKNYTSDDSDKISQKNISKFINKLQRRSFETTAPWSLWEAKSFITVILKYLKVC